MTTKLDLEQFEKDPNLFLERIIKDYAASSPGNSLPDFDGIRIFDEPLVGFADGDDAIFQDYKNREIIGEFHMTPREALEKYLRSKGREEGLAERPVSVISMIMPVSREIRLSQRRESRVPSFQWNRMRWKGEDFINELSRYLVSLLEELGHEAVVPDLTEFFGATEVNGIRRSNWSHRHMAYAAGLGTFSLTDAFISRRGIAERCGSVVTDVALTPTPRIYENHLANCLFYREGTCGRCIERCPSGAISERGHDKKRCREWLLFEQPEVAKEIGRGEGYIGKYLGCGLCQTKVPCEDRIPPDGSGKPRD